MQNWLTDFLTKLKADLANAHKSMTIWFNVLAGTAAVALPIVQENLPQLQDYVPANFYHYAMGVVVVGNFLLRFKTTSALRDK